ncbi:MAG: hypothetical protein EOM02_00335 [Synergistales bacterium]|nr:hypothetical protein [Synergistales bacterium]
MIVNNGMKGALIRNAGLPGQYLEDLPPDDGSQRLYNLRDYSARFGGVSDLGDSSILLSDGRRMSLFNYIKTEGATSCGAGTSTVTFDEDAESVSFSAFVASGATYTANCQVSLPPDMQSFSASISWSQKATSGEFKPSLSLLRLMQGEIPFATSDYLHDKDVFRGIDFRVGSVVINPGNSSSVTISRPDLVNTGSLKFFYTSHDGLCQMERDGVTVVLGHIDPPNILFIGLGGYNNSWYNMTVARTILPSL